ncbi:MAG: elongation factor G [bacterium]
MAEAILFMLKYTDRMGRVEDGNTVSDYDAEEVRRHASINASLLPVEYRDHKINFLDLPGYRDFVGEIKNCIRAADGLMVVIDATSGVEVGTEFAWEYANEFGVPRAFFINKLDKERAGFAKAVEGLQKHFGASGRIVQITLPVGEQAGFRGIVDLLQMKFLIETNGSVAQGDIPAELKEEAESARQALVEAAAEGDDELTMKFLDDQPLSEEEVVRGLREGVAAGKVFPILCGSAVQMKGLNSLLDFCVNILPSPLDRPGLETKKGDEIVVQPYDAGKPFSAFVFKTVSDPYAGHVSFLKVVTGELNGTTHVVNLNKQKHQKISNILTLRGKKSENINKLVTGDIGALAKLDSTATNDTLASPAFNTTYTATKLPAFTCHAALMGSSKTDEEKIGLAIHRLIEQDPTLSVHRDSAVRQTIISGMGDTHLDVAVHRLQTIANVAVQLVTPKVPYRETITAKAEGQGKYKKQSGGRGQYGDCWLRLEPLPEGSGFEYDWAIVGGVIPTKYEPSVEKGLKEALERGIQAGYPVVDIKISCYDGSYHSVDSSDMAFKVAASLGFKKIAQVAKPIILEPIYKVKIIVPETYMGDIMGDLNSKRGRILGMSNSGTKNVIEALVPLAEMFSYSKDLRSISQGRGMFEMEYHHYERVPGEIQTKIIAEAIQHKEEEEE